MIAVFEDVDEAAKDVAVAAAAADDDGGDDNDLYDCDVLMNAVVVFVDFCDRFASDVKYLNY